MSRSNGVPKPLSSHINRLFILATLLTVCVIAITVFIYARAGHAQAAAQASQENRALLDREWRQLYQEFVNEQYYARTIRGQQIERDSIEGNFGTQVGFYGEKPDSKEIFESSAAKAIREAIAGEHLTNTNASTQSKPVLPENKEGVVTTADGDEYAWLTRTVVFGGEKHGVVLFARRVSDSAGKVLLYAAGGVIATYLISMATLLVVSRKVMKSAVINPIKVLSENVVPEVERYVNEDTAVMTARDDLNSAEFLGLSRTIRSLGERLKKEQTRRQQAKLEADRERLKSEFATVVAHNIRQPLAALLTVTKSVKDIPEEDRVLIRSVSQRITDMANELLYKAKGKLSFDKMNTDVYLVQSLVERIMTEFKLQYSGSKGVAINVNDPVESYGLFVSINPGEFHGVFSNLLVNAIEALEGQGGKISVEIVKDGDKNAVLLRVKDNGHGIEKDLLKKLGEAKVQSTKPNGSGLGVYHSAKTIKNAGGKLTFSSILGEETIATLELPIAEAPIWFCPTIDVAEDQSVVVVDDDNTIHKVWERRFCESDNEKKVKVHHYHSVAEFDYEWPTISDEVGCLLVDHELIGETDSGMDLIEHYALGSKSILVTSKYDQKDVIDSCEKNGIKLLPKYAAAFIKINTASG